MAAIVVMVVIVGIVVVVIVVVVLVVVVVVVLVIIIIVVLAIVNASSPPQPSSSQTRGVFWPAPAQVGPAARAVAPQALSAPAGRRAPPKVQPSGRSSNPDESIAVRKTKN